MNIKCDGHTKKLIRKKTRDIVPFPFELQSPYITSTLNHLTLNMKDSILVAISLFQVKEYLQKKLWNKSAFNLVDWQSRAQVMKILSPLIKVWLSKSFTNFAGTSYRLCQQGR